MSKFLPIENIVYKTKHSKEQTIQKLSENIEAEKSFGFGVNSYTYSKPYIGRVIGSNFEIKRAISYRNSFLPQIKGEVYSEFDGTKIKVNMKPHIFVLVFMTIWFGGVFIGCVATIFALFTQEFTPFFLIPFGMLLFGIALLYGAFKTESSTSKKDLIRILEAEIQQ
jgi:hypothetical protein